jgi:hypothetical protein
MSSRSINGSEIQGQRTGKALRKRGQMRRGKLRRNLLRGRTAIATRLELMWRLESLRQEISEERRGRARQEVWAACCGEVGLNVTAANFHEGFLDKTDGTNERANGNSTKVRSLCVPAESGGHSVQKLDRTEDSTFYDSADLQNEPIPLPIQLSEAGLKLWGLDWDLIEADLPGSGGGYGRGN